MVRSASPAKLPLSSAQLGPRPRLLVLALRSTRLRHRSEVIRESLRALQI